MTIEERAARAVELKAGCNCAQAVVLSYADKLPLEEETLKKLAAGDRAAEALRAYPDVIGVFWPEVLPMVGFDQRNRHHCYDVWSTPSTPWRR